MASKIGQLLVWEALTWLETPWVKSGQDKSGVDCLNFIGSVAKALDVLSDLMQRDYSFGFWKRHPGDLIVESIEYAGENSMSPNYELLHLEDGAALEPGDLLAVCQLRKLEKATHAVFVEKMETWGVSILHANQDSQKVEKLNRMPLHWRIIRAYRIVEVP